MSCYYCGNERVISKGLCNACCLHLRRHGTLERKIKNKPKNKCSIDGCCKVVVARGYCDAHYRQNLRKGDPISTFGYGERKSHHLYHSWATQIKAKEGRDDAWNDFWEFVRCVGEKPSERHQLRRYDMCAPWGPSNFYWKEKVACSLDRAKYSREWRAKNRIASKSHSLKKQFGITMDDYMRMYESQDGKCAICGSYGEPFAGSNGKSITLAVDHCHKTGNIRKLLCPMCNKGLGFFNDSIKSLQLAIKYLADCG